MVSSCPSPAGFHLHSTDTVPLQGMLYWTHCQHEHTLDLCLTHQSVSTKENF
uniref:Uncharacterized protein n=1 Tax=Rhizophora mucronata TaxID=61149 RepID=A0A2P2K0T3_RHIMU